MNFIDAQIVAHTDVNLTKLIATATRITFKKNNPFNTDMSQTTKFDESIVHNLIMTDHSPLEMGDVTILLTGISKSLLAQWTRARLQSVISSSMHYVNQDTYQVNENIPQFVVPIEVYQKCDELNTTEPLNDFIQAYEASQRAYLEFFPSASLAVQM